MTEQEWRECDDPQKMLEFLRDTGGASERKLRLLAAAVCRHLRDFLWQLSAVEVAERHADGFASRQDLAHERGEALRVAGSMYRHLAAEEVEAGSQQVAAATAPDAAGGADLAVEVAQRTHRGEASPLLRDIFGPLPFRPITFDPAWQMPDVVALAQAAYENRFLPEGHLDRHRLAVLADALLDAGCPQDAELLLHLRGDAAHVRGCWAIDLLTGRE